MQRFTELAVWQKAHELTLAVYRDTVSFPVAERCGLVGQMRRAASSIACNIAEGSKRLTARDYARFLNMAEGSGSELQYLLLLARDLGHLDPASWAEHGRSLDEILAMLCRLRTSVLRNFRPAPLSTVNCQLPTRSHP